MQFVSVALFRHQLSSLADFLRAFCAPGTGIHFDLDFTMSRGLAFKYTVWFLRPAKIEVATRVKA